jgi:N-methylhydantoinase B/oxoprolinase/acetone carboxylase alpha subunit
MSADPVTAAVIASAVRANAMEMSEALRRSSHSPIIREMLDYSCGVFTPTGETVAQDELIPAFLGAMASTMPHVIEAAGDELRPGDAWMTNDPYVGGTHTPDIQVFMPVLHDGKLVAWCGNIAHHNDVGGTNPGTEGYANGSIFEEGVRIPPLRFVDDGEVNHSLLRLLENNVRDPGSLAGDLRAQLAAAKLGQRRMYELLGRYGPDVLGAAMEEVLDQSERRIRAAIAARPNGSTIVEGWLDDDGLGSDPVGMRAKIEILDDAVRVDMTGSARQMRGGLNLSATAAQAAIVYAVKAMFDPEAPQNGGVVRAVESVLPKGSLVNPDFPAAVSLRHLGALRLADTLIRGFGEMCEQQFMVRIVATELVPDSGGPGEFRGGLGIRRVYEFLEDADDGVYYTEQAREQFAPQGIRGGLPGTSASLVIERTDGSRREITKERLAMRAGDRLIVTTGGGGGYGDPIRRDRSAVLRDLREGKVTELVARDIYRTNLMTPTPSAVPAEAV